MRHAEVQKVLQGVSLFSSSSSKAPPGGSVPGGRKNRGPSFANALSDVASKVDQLTSELASAQHALAHRDGVLSDMRSAVEAYEQDRTAVVEENRMLRAYAERADEVVREEKRWREGAAVEVRECAERKTNRS